MVNHDIAIPPHNVLTCSRATLQKQGISRARILPEAGIDLIRPSVPNFYAQNDKRVFGKFLPDAFDIRGLRDTVGSAITKEI